MGGIVLPISVKMLIIIMGQTGGFGLGQHLLFGDGINDTEGCITMVVEKLHFKNHM